VTTISSSVNETSTASATGLLAKVLIPSDDKRFAVLLNQIVEFAKFGAAKAARLGERDGREPELGVTLGLLDVNVVRFCALTAEKEKAVSVDTKHLWHRRIVSGMSMKARSLIGARTPNDPKLSDGRLGRDACAVGGKAAAEAGGVTETPVRCSAWLGVAVIELNVWNKGRPERVTPRIVGNGREAAVCDTPACDGNLNDTMRREALEVCPRNVNTGFRIADGRSVRRAKQRDNLIRRYAVADTPELRGKASLLTPPLESAKKVG
jgi:hypothetical protein